MSKNVKQQVLDELNSRIDRLKKHADDPIVQADNNYDVLNQALSKTIGEPPLQRAGKRPRFCRNPVVKTKSSRRKPPSPATAFAGGIAALADGRSSAPGGSFFCFANALFTLR